ncbi:MAG: serine protease, partial [Cyanobacteria bacterium J06649_11]
MKLSVKQLAVSLSLVTIGGGAGLLGSRFLPQSHSSNQYKSVTVALPPEAVINRPVEKSAAGSRGGEMNFIASAVQKTGSA